MGKLIEINNEYINIDTSSKHKIGAQIIERRETLGISQSDLTKLLKISLSDLITIEADMLPPDLEVIIDVCRIFKCTADYLLGSSSDPKKTRNFQ